MAQGGDEWELSKENVRPLKQGRAMSTLQEVLAQQESSSHTAIQQQKQAFELEIRFSSGEDPLDVWDRYIKWAEQTFPQSGKESNLSELLERTVKMFHEEPTYYQDLRYLNLWLKFAHFCTEPLDLYSYLHGHGIGTSHAALYITWAEVYEARGNYKKADSIFQEGIQHNAEPLDKLHCHHREFQARLSRQVLQGITEGEGEVEEAGLLAVPETQRSSLADLKCRGKKKARAPIGRVGDFVKPARQVFGIQFPAPQQVQVGTRFEVFNENEAANPRAELQELTPQPWVAPPPARAKENELGAKPWNSGRLPRSNQIPGSEAPCALPSFTPYVEESAQQQIMTPCKINPSITSVLSARKPSKDEDPLQRVQCRSEDKEEMPMYCKLKVYAGLEEFSFEEIRAEIYIKKMRKRRAEELQASAQRRLEMEKKIAEMEKQLMETENKSKQHPVEQVAELSKPQAIQMVSSDDLNSFAIQDPATLLCRSLQTEFSPQERHPPNASPRDNQPIKKEQGHYHACLEASNSALTLHPSMPFTIFDESASSETADARLPVPCFGRPLTVLHNPSSTMTDMNDNQSEDSARNITPSSSNEIDGIEPLNEDPIVNSSDETKTLSPIPEESCGFSRAAHFLSTPFRSLATQSDELNTDPETSQMSNCTFDRQPLSENDMKYEQSTYNHTPCVKKLSPILEFSQEDAPASVSSASSAGMFTIKNVTPQENIEFSHRLPIDIAKASGGDHEQTTELSSKALWCTQLRKQLLESLSDLKCSFEFHQETEPMPLMEEQKDVTLGEESYILTREIKLGEDDKIFFGIPNNTSTSKMKGVVLKICSLPVPWDFYITLQLKERLGAGFDQNFEKCCTFLYSDGCVTLYQDINQLSVKDLMQDFDIEKDDLVVLFAHCLISLVEKLHSVEIVHGDLRPDILLLSDRMMDSFMSKEDDGVLKLVDFSHSLDLRLQPKLVSLTGFPTAQSQLGQQILSQCSSPYQVDMLGIAETVHFMLFGKQLQVHQDDSLWQLSQDVHRDWNSDVWPQFFTKILNSDDKSTVSLLRELKEELSQLFDRDFKLRLFCCLFDLF